MRKDVQLFDREAQKDVKSSNREIRKDRRSLYRISTSLRNFLLTVHTYTFKIILKRNFKVHLF